MEKFQELLAEAAQLKQAQLKNQRKNYQSLPDYLKSGLNYARKYRLLRLQPYTIQMTISENIKNQGNQLFKSQRYEQALSRYEQALGVFRFILAKSYDNMKDQDLMYEFYQLSEEDKGYKEEYEGHLVAIHLNICSTLTKLNRKNDAIHSADEALKIKETAKAYYKKAQSYIQFINRDSEDIKLGFYYLNKSYEISKDAIIIQQMHKVKKQIQEQKDKEKQWFKFMFDKNSKEAEKKQITNKVIEKKPEVQSKQKQGPILSENLQRFEKQKGEQVQKEDQRLQKTKEKLMKYASSSLSQQQWIQSYQGQFIAKHGSKIYSILQLYGYKQFLGEYKALLAQCLQYRKEVEDYHKRKEIYEKYFQWLRSHPVDKISKYIQRYQLQAAWIKQQRSKGGKEILHKNLPALKQVKQQQQVKINAQLDQQTVVDSKIQQKILSFTENLSNIKDQPQLQTKILQNQQKKSAQQNSQTEQIPTVIPKEQFKSFSQIKILAICIAIATIISLTLIF